MLPSSPPIHTRKHYDQQQSNTLQLPPEDPAVSIYSVPSMLSLHSAFDEGTSKTEDEVRGWGQLPLATLPSKALLAQRKCYIRCQCLLVVVSKRLSQFTEPRPLNAGRGEGPR